jgi:hypothetical protein
MRTTIFKRRIRVRHRLPSIQRVANENIETQERGSVRWQLLRAQLVFLGLCRIILAVARIALAALCTLVFAPVNLMMRLAIGLDRLRSVDCPDQLKWDTKSNMDLTQEQRAWISEMESFDRF